VFQYLLHFGKPALHQLDFLHDMAPIQRDRFRWLIGFIRLTRESIEETDQRSELCEPKRPNLIGERAVALGIFNKRAAKTNQSFSFP
jgi:hypothetical protein